MRQSRIFHIALSTDKGPAIGGSEYYTASNHSPEIAHVIDLIKRTGIGEGATPKLYFCSLNTEDQIVSVRLRLRRPHLSTRIIWFGGLSIILERAISDLPSRSPQCVAFQVSD